MSERLSKFVKRDTQAKLMFGWVSAIKHNLPSISIDRAIQTYYKYFEIDPEEYPIITAKTTYQRMQQEWLNTLKKKDKNDSKS